MKIRASANPPYQIRPRGNLTIANDAFLQRMANVRFTTDPGAADVPAGLNVLHYHGGQSPKYRELRIGPSRQFLEGVAFEALTPTSVPTVFWVPLASHVLCATRHPLKSVRSIVQFGLGQLPFENLKQRSCWRIPVSSMVQSWYLGRTEPMQEITEDPAFRNAINTAREVLQSLRLSAYFRTQRLPNIDASLLLDQEQRLYAIGLVERLNQIESLRVFDPPKGTQISRLREIPNIRFMLPSMVASNPVVVTWHNNIHQTQRSFDLSNGWSCTFGLELRRTFLKIHSPKNEVMLDAEFFANGDCKLIYLETDNGSMQLSGNQGRREHPALASFSPHLHRIAEEMDRLRLFVAFQGLLAPYLQRKPRHVTVILSDADHQGLSLSWNRELFTAGRRSFEIAQKMGLRFANKKVAQALVSAKRGSSVEALLFRPFERPQEIYYQRKCEIVGGSVEFNLEVGASNSPQAIVETNLLEYSTTAFGAYPFRGKMRLGKHETYVRLLPSHEKEVRITAIRVPDVSGKMRLLEPFDFPGITEYGFTQALMDELNLHHVRIGGLWVHFSPILEDWDETKMLADFHQDEGVILQDLAAGKLLMHPNPRKFLMQMGLES